MNLTQLVKTGTIYVEIGIRIQTPQ